MARPQPKCDFTIQRDKYFTNDIIPYPYSDTDFPPNSLNAPPSQTLPSSIPAPSNRLLLRVPPPSTLHQRPRRNRLPTNDISAKRREVYPRYPNYDREPTGFYLPYHRDYKW